MRRPLVLILVAVLMLATMVSLLLIARHKGAEKSVLFPNGVEVRVLGAFPGGKSVSSDKPWMAALRRSLPARFQTKLPPSASIVCGSGSTNQLVVFFELTTIPWEWVAAVDDDGFAYPRFKVACISGIGNGRSLYAVPLEVFPRRQKSFRLDFLDAASKVLAQTRLANPLPVTLSEQAWKAEALPTTQTNGGLALTLVSLSEATNPWGSYLSPRWRTQTSDGHGGNPRVGYPRLADPVGNEGSMLSRKEKVWQIKTTVHRTRLQDFAPDEKLSVTNLVVPATAEMIPLNMAADCAGVKVLVEGFYGAGTLCITNGLKRGMRSSSVGGWEIMTLGRTTVESIGFKQPSLLLEIAGMLKGDELIVRTTDSQARGIATDEPLNYRYRGGSGVRIYQIGIDAEGSSQPLSIEIAINRPKEFVFYIDPKDIQPPQ